MRLSLLVALWAGLAIFFSGCGVFADDDDAEIEQLKQAVEKLRKDLSAKEKETQPLLAARADELIAHRGGHAAPVTSTSGKLTIGGLLEIWNYSVQHDNYDVFDSKGNDALCCNSYRIRRSELRLKAEITENITARLMFDMAREATSFPGVPSNQGLFKSWAANLNVPGTYQFTPDGRVDNGAGIAPRLLQDAYLNFHDIVPNHEFQIGQFQPPVGEEGTRDNGYLDFAERAMVTQFNETRDLGLQIYGRWWDKRLQYWAGLFDGAGNYFGTAGNTALAQLGTFDSANRADDNSNKDFAGRIAFRPIWEMEDWGNLELGGSLECGKHGGVGDPTLDASAPVNGLNNNAVFARREAAWLFYKPQGPVHGMWLRGEWGLQHDRTPPFTVDAFGLGSGPFGSQAAPTPFSRQGWYASAGYKLMDSYFADRLNGGGFWNYLFQPVEFVCRYETFQNIVTEDPAAPDTHTNLYSTNAITAGINYYVNAYSMRVQMNGILVNEPERSWSYGQLRNVRNNVLLFTYQVLF